MFSQLTWNSTTFKVFLLSLSLPTRHSIFDITAKSILTRFLLIVLFIESFYRCFGYQWASRFLDIRSMSSLQVRLRMEHA